MTILKYFFLDLFSRPELAIVSIIIIVFLSFSCFILIIDPILTNRRIRKENDKILQENNARKKRIRKDIADALSKAVGGKPLSPSQRITLQTISNLLHDLLRTKDELLEHHLFAGFEYIKCLEDIKSKVSKSELPKSVIGASIKIVSKELRELDGNSTYTLVPLANFMRKYEKKS